MAKRIHIGSAVLAVAALVAAGCTSDGGGQAIRPFDPAAPADTVAVPPERLAPFCQAMIDLSDRLAANPPVDPATLIVTIYGELVDVVPDVIADDFRAVLAELRGEPLPTVPVPTGSDAPATVTTIASPSATTGTTGPAGSDAGASAGSGPAGSGPVDTGPVDTSFEEGYGPGETPSERVNDYVDFVCRANQNNPGPPATEPLPNLDRLTVP